MALERMEHVTIDTDDVEKTKTFYCDVLGMTDGYRPDFGFEGLWLYVGDVACVHVCEWDSYKVFTEERGIPMSRRGNGTGAFDHVAFNAKDYEGTVARIEKAGLDYGTAYVPDIPLRQIFIKDPNGVIVELNFRDE